MAEVEDDITRQIEQDVRELELHSKNTGNIRSTIVEKLSKVVDVMVINPGDSKASMIEAQMGVFNTLLSALKDSDNQKLDIIKLKQKMKADTIQETSLKQISNTVAEYMRRITPVATLPSNTGDSTGESSDEELDAAVEKSEIEVLPGELEMTTKSAKDIELE